MAPIPNPRILFTKAPVAGNFLVEGENIVYEKSPTIDLDQKLESGQFLTKTLLLSPEPYMRDRMRDPSRSSYGTPMKLGQPIVGNGLVLVLRSEKEGIKAGDYMCGFTPWEAYTVQPYVDARVEFKGFAPGTLDMDTLSLHQVSNPGSAFPWRTFCNALGMPGFTGFVGFEKFGDAKPGETIYVSSGASGVGSMVIQLAKIKGLKVIASAGSDEKVEYMRTIGADAPFNYKRSNSALQDELKAHGPIDIYFDNVGGEHLEAALDNMNLNGRVIACGAISEYNIPWEKKDGIKNMGRMFPLRLTLRGFIIGDHLGMQPRFLEEIPPLVARGKLRLREHLFHGLETGIEAFQSMFNGKATAKPIIVVDEEYAS
ncbi:hypothetical protein C8F04DRAFT_1001500 [Mycena alexandri]|uniref:Enoyl reductase (ER) domain-containing protein n=1 Tax=Mycena alexandri TaxID=1745969 RepID=A0AAD6SWA1_9AGAR|nr:hypothetical protein C8F04DRAFT_1001500 [Mycena alexandri]